MKSTIIPELLRGLQIDIDHPSHGGKRYNKCSTELQCGLVITTDSVWLYPTIHYDVSHLEEECNISCSITWAFQITPIHSIVVAEMPTDINDCLVYMKEHLEKILNTIYCKQLDNNTKYIVPLPPVSEQEYNLSELYLAIQNFLLS